MVGGRADATEHYRTQTAAFLLALAAREALDDGLSPYLTLLTVVASAFRQPDEGELQITEGEE